MCHSHIVKSPRMSKLIKTVLDSNKAEGKTCLTCYATRQAYGNMLECSLTGRMMHLHDTCRNYRDGTVKCSYPDNI